MKSRILLTKFTWENVKKQVWIPCMVFTLLFLSLAVPTLMQIQVWNANDSYSLKEIQTMFKQLLCNGSLLASVSTIISATIVGVVGFSYLHSKRKSDFLYSLPIRRERLHLMQFTLGFLYYFIPLVLVYVITIMIGGVNHLITLDVFAGIGYGFLFEVLVFLFSYLCTILAMQLTGRMFVGILGVIGFYGYSLGVMGILRTFFQIFFTSYSYSDDTFQGLMYVSPIGVLLRKQILMSDYGNNNTYDANQTIFLILTTMAIISGLFFLTYMLSKKRPAEAAGKSMAFKKLEVITRVLITGVCALGGGIFVYQMGYASQLAWGIFGTVFSVVLVNGILEVIFHMDFKKFVSKKLQLILMIAGTLLVFLSFRYDWMNYDGFLPKQSKVESISIVLENVYNDMNYEKPSTSMREKGRYLDATTYLREEMRLPCTDEVYDLLEELVKGQKAMYSEGTDQVVDVARIEHSEDTYIPYVTMQVGYRMKGSRVKNRTYTVNANKIQPFFEKVAGSKEYVNAMYPVLRLSGGDINTYQLNSEALNFSGENITEEGKNWVSGEGAGVSELLEAYQKDLSEITGKEILSETPIGQVTFYNRKPGSKQDYLYNSGPSPIYKSFEHTVDWFEQKGITIISNKSATNIKRIVITDYREETTDEKNSKDKPWNYNEHVFEEQKEIDRLVPYLRAYNLKSPFMKDETDAGVRVDMKYLNYANTNMEYYSESADIFTLIEELELARDAS